MTQKQIHKRVFDEIRKKYPSRLIELSMKEELLQKCIQTLYKDEFEAISNKYKTNSKTKKIEGNEKVLDEGVSGQPNQGTRKKQRMDNRIYEAIKIIVKAYETNTAINQIYSYQNVQEMVKKAKITFKDLIQNQKEKEKCKVGQKNVQPKKNKNIQPVEKIRENKQEQKQIQKIEQKDQSVLVEPKCNSLSVETQIPICEINIFKEQNRESDSRLVNNNANIITPQQPRQQSSKNSRKEIPPQEPSKSIPITTDNMTLQNQQQEKLEQEEQIQDQEQQQQDREQPKYNQQIPEKKIEQQKIVIHSKNELHLPSFKLSNQRSISKKNPIDSILTNPYIKKAFSHLCKQSYIGGGKTFDQIAQSADIMTLNKWMVFCKEFDFLSKFKKKQLVDIFQQVTSNMPRMNQQQFLDALIIVQNKLKVDEQDFIHKNMCLDSEFAFRQKVASFKISYAGPKQNSFEQATLKPIDKYYIQLREDKYQQQKKKQKQILLCQGKFKEQIQNELMDRKNQRDLKRSRMLNSMVINKDSRLNNVRRILSGSVDVKNMQNQPIKSPYLNYVQNIANSRKNQTSFSRYEEDSKSSKLQITRRIDPISYSEIFSHKNSISTRAFTTENQNSKLRLEENKTKPMDNLSKNQQNNQRSISQLSKINFNKESQKNQIKIHQTTQRKPEKAQQIRPQRQWVQQAKDWSQEFDKSSSQESDEILKEHLKREKLQNIDLPQNMKLSKIMEQFKNDQKWLQPNEQQDFNSSWDRVTQLQTTNKKLRSK